MKRPAYVAIAPVRKGGRLGSAASVAVIHVAAILGLLTALNQGTVLKELQIIQASIDAPQEITREPPPAPPDLIKPTPPVAIPPVFSVQKPESAPPSITTVPAQTSSNPAPVAAPAPAPSIAPSDPLRPIMRTHTLPPYPPIARRLNEQGTSLLEVSISSKGDVSDCRIAQSSGSERLDTAGCDFVTRNWRWQPPTKEGKPVSAKTRVSIQWDLRASD